MPTLSLEISENLLEHDRLEDILLRLAQVTASFETVDSKAVKAYVHMNSLTATGEGAPKGFAALQLAILEGRDSALRNLMADTLFAEMRALFAHSLDAGLASVTVEIRQMEKATYRK